MESNEDNPKAITGQKLSVSNMNKVYDDCNMPAILLSIGFKLVPIIIYLLFKILTDQYLTTFILISLLMSCDFWVTKNITGRRLAALRWYSKTDDENKETWCFESSQNRVPSSINVGIFWFDQLIAILFWIVIALINIFTLSVFWVFLAIFSSVLLIINFVLYIQCKGDHQKRVNSFAHRLGMQFFELNEEKN